MRLKNKSTLAEGYRLLHEGALALSKIEANGIRVDVNYLNKTIPRVERKIARAEKRLRKSKEFEKWRSRYGRKTNLGSHEQLGNVLSLMGHKLPVTIKSAFKRIDEDEEEVELRWSTRKTFLQELDLPFANEWIKNEEMKKALGTYLLGIKRELVGEYIHPFFPLYTTISTRGSSKSPNFQNMPTRSEIMGELIRMCFIARRGRLLLEIDFKAIEVCVAAMYHLDPTMMKYLKDPHSDMHRDAAQRIFFLNDKEIEFLKKTARYYAKNQFVFPQFYGSIWFHCAPQLWKSMIRGKWKLPDGTLVEDRLRKHGIKKLGTCEAKEDPEPNTFADHVRKIEHWFWRKQFPVYAQWKRDWYEAYQQRGWFDLYTGFRIEGEYSRNQVTNIPIQGCAFHCLLKVLTMLQEWIEEQGLRCKIIGQIHDSMLLDCPINEKEIVLAKIRELVEVDLPKIWKWICVPLTVEAEMSPLGKTWYDKAPMPGLLPPRKGMKLHWIDKRQEWRWQ